MIGDRVATFSRITPAVSVTIAASKTTKTRAVLHFSCPSLVGDRIGSDPSPRRSLCAFNQPQTYEPVWLVNRSPGSQTCNDDRLGSSPRDGVISREHYQ